ncbi:MAG: cupin [Spirochaetes bacterium]|nr:cupin [Spirochaetota bacterium]
MKKIREITSLQAAGTPPKLIEEFIGNVNSGNSEISIARMKSPQGWNEPGQTPEFDEYTIVLRGTLVAEGRDERHEIGENQALMVKKGEWVRYSTPRPGGAEYIAICLPAFSPDLAHRDDGQ